MEEGPYVEFPNGSRIYFSGVPEEGNRLRGSDDPGGDFIRRGPREVSAEIILIIEPEMMKELPTPFDFDEREPDGSVVIGG